MKARLIAYSVAALLCCSLSAQERMVDRDSLRRVPRASWSSVMEWYRDSVYRIRNAGGKLDVLQERQTKASISLAHDDEVPELEYRKSKKDTLVIQDDKGNDMLIMKAIKDEETGEMVASDVIDAAVVTARFRNVAERHGKIDIEFQIVVPKSMQDSKWQLRFYPDMFVLEDSLRLDPVIITGAGYRRAQLKGYEQYEKFLSKIVSDTTTFIRIGQLEMFLKRNIPQVFAFKTDSTEVSDEKFYSFFGVSEQAAVAHYTNQFAKDRNKRRIAMKGKMYRRYVKAPIVTEGIRLDTIIQNINGDFIYNYVQTINTRPKLRKVDIILSGDIYEQDKRIYTIPRSEPLTFYISSVSSFVRMDERYLKKVIERRAEANTSCNIDFGLGRWNVDLTLGSNQSEMERIKQNIGDLLQNTVYDLDSIVVTASASPEGSWALNDKLSKKRSESLSDYLDHYIKHFQDSLEYVNGFSVNESGDVVRQKRMKIPFVSYSNPEDWDKLDYLVRNDTLMTDEQIESYFALADQFKDKDAREMRMKKEAWYPHLKEDVYPKLRSVKFDFHLHRKGMIKDTVMTTELDSAYMRGIQAIRDRDYQAAAILLAPYQDYNTAVAYVCLDRNLSALQILEKEERTAQVNYMLAIVYSRLGNEKDAVQCYLLSCRQESTYVHRGNLDPEISQLIRLYGLNKQDEEDDFSY